VHAEGSRGYAARPVRGGRVRLPRGDPAGASPRRGVLPVRLGAPVARAAERGAGGARPLRRAGRPVARARLGAGRVGARAAGRAAQEVEVGGDQGQGPHVMTDMDPPTTLEGAAPTLIVETVVLRFLARVIHADGVVDPREVKLLLDVAAGLEMGEEE